MSLWSLSLHSTFSGKNKVFKYFLAVLVSYTKKGICVPSVTPSKDLHKEEGLGSGVTEKCGMIPSYERRITKNQNLEL